MPLRPTFKPQQNRPNSAIYIGNGNPNANANSASSATTSTTLAHIPPSSAPAHLTHHRTPSLSSIPPGLPDLPEPPSPVLSNSSAGSGLPSPPATNSTGSGSTGDPSTVALRRYPESRTMLNRKPTFQAYQHQLNIPSRSNSRASQRFCDGATAEHGEYDPDADFTDDFLDEDSTARLRLGNSAALVKHAMEASSRESVAALARVKSLAQRNRQALDKLTSITRLTSPTPPSVSKRHSRTTTAPSNSFVTSVVQSSSSSQTPSSRPSTSLSSTRSERTRVRASLPPPVTPSTSQEQGLSGSETERETSSSLYAHHSNNSSPSLHHYASNSLSTISSSPSSSTTPHSLPQDFIPDYNASNAHTPMTPHTVQQQPSQQQRRTDSHSKHHRIASLASASTPYLPSTSHVFHTPQSAQPLTKTRSTGSTSVTGASSSSSASMGRTRLTTPASSRPSTAGGYINGNVGKNWDDGSTSSSSPRRRRRAGSGGSSLQGIQPLSSRHYQEEQAQEVRASKRNTTVEEGKDVAQAALAAVAASRSRTSLDTRRRSALPRDWEVLDEDNHAPDPITPYRSGTSANHGRNLDRDGLNSAASFSQERGPSKRGGSAESALTTRGPTSTRVAGSRSVITEVLKAVGLSPRRDRRLERERETDRQSFLADGDVFEDHRRDDWAAEEERLPISEFGERGARMRERERERTALPGSRSATSMSLSRYSSRSRSRARTGDDENLDSGLREDDVTKTAPAGLRAYRHMYSTPGDSERDVVHLSLMKKEKELERERDKARDRDMRRESITERSMTSLGRYSTPVHQTGSSSAVLTNAPPHQDRNHTAPYGRRHSPQVSFNHTGSTGDNARAPSRQSALVPAERTEHARLMVDSLAMFEGHMTRISSSEGGSFNPMHIAELLKTAQGVVASADRLNGFLRAASKDAVEREIDAEVADDVEISENGGRGGGMYTAKDMVQVWKIINADYKEGIKASDELVRGITTFLLGIGRVIRDMGILEEDVERYPASTNGGGSSSAHARSVSLNDDIIRSARGASPAPSGGSGSRHSSNATGRRSLDISRRGWEPSPSVTAASNAREEALKRLTGRSDGTPGVRASSSILSRERDRSLRYESPMPHSGRQDSTYAQSRSSTVLSGRWLPSPREQRPQEQQQRPSRLPLSESEDILASTSQDTITPYEPSPSPAPRIRDTLDRQRNLPPLKIPKPLPSLPSSSSLRQERGTPDADSYSISETSTSTRGHERRKASNTSISTVRGAAASPYPAVLNPSGGGATTAVTTHTVSNTPIEVTPTSAATFSIPSTESRRNMRSTITFSKPSTESVPTLAGLQQQYEGRQRTTESMPPTPMSGSETERPPKRQTWGVRAGSKARVASDESGRVSLGRAADRSAAASSLFPHLSSTKRERTAVTELFPES